MSKQVSHEKQKEDETRVGPSVPRDDRQDLPRRSNGATPGPWTAHESALSRNGDLWFIIASTQDRVAEVSTTANANLIAAAPELLAALKHAVAVDTEFRRRNGEPIRTPEYQESYDTVLAAIAKAEGKESR